MRFCRAVAAFFRHFAKRREVTRSLSPSSSPPAPSDVRATIRSLLALPELSYRVAWLAERWHKSPIEQTALQFEKLAQAGQGSDKGAREALFSLCILLARHHDSSWTWALREHAHRQHLNSLERLVRSRPEPSVPPPSSTRKEARIPDYGAGRELTVGERRSLARRPSRSQLEKLLLDPHALVLEQLFQCPSLTEIDVVTVATRRPPSQDALRLLVQANKWIARRRVRMSLILNPASPHAMVVPLVATCPREDLRLISSTTTINSTLRSVALELFRALPPVDRSTSHPLYH